MKFRAQIYILLWAGFMVVACDSGLIEQPSMQTERNGSIGQETVDTSETKNKSEEVTPTPDANIQTTSTIDQYGVTFTFDKEYPYGQFANGDWWVVGPITVVSITPDAVNNRNGYEINPGDTKFQPYDNRIKGYNSALMPALPLVVAGSKSIVKTISISDEETTCEPCLQTAVVLTVLDSIPQDLGQHFFRPPYFGSAKPLYDTRDLRPERLPSLSDPSSASTPTLAWVESKFGRVQFDHKKGWDGRAMHPISNMSDYGAAIAANTADAALRLMLSDSFEAKKKAMIAYVQAGLDLYHMMKNGQTWIADGGHSSGRKLPILFAGFLLDRSEILDDVKNAPLGTFGEDGQTYYNSSGVALWGAICSENTYWTRIATGSGRRDCRDPYGQIDGGGSEIGWAYQKCCTSKVWKGPVLIGNLIPAIKESWNHNAFFDYVDRWVTSGALAIPDTCSLTKPDPLTGTCVSGGPRFPDRHGVNKNIGDYGSVFSEAMWDAYR